MLYFYVLSYESLFVSVVISILKKSVVLIFSKASFRKLFFNALESTKLSIEI